MLREVSNLLGYAIHTKDGEDMGKVHDLYFDRTDWTTRYLVVDIGSWFSGRRVLVSNGALGTPRWDQKALEVNLTKAQVKDSPNIDLASPVTRSHEVNLFNYYGWPSTWNSPAGFGTGLGAAEIGPTAYAQSTAASADMPREVTEGLENAEESRIYGVREVTNDTIKAKDGDIGHVADFILDDETWVIRYLVIDTGSWLPGKKVLLSTRWVESVDWNASKVYVDVNRAKIENSPQYDASLPIQRDYERELHEHYGYPEYW